MMPQLRLVHSVSDVRRPEAKRMQEGFVAIQNDVFDAILKADLSKRQQTVFLAILRKVQGYNKDYDHIATSQLAVITGMQESHVRQALIDLQAMNLIERGQRRSIGTKISLNLDISSWDIKRTESVRSDAKSVRSHRIGTSIRTDLAPTTDNSNKQEEPPVVPQPTSSAKPARPKRTAMTMRSWLAAMKAEGQQPIPEDDPVFDYASKAGIPVEFLRLCWCEFRDRYLDAPKTYKDWRAAFRLCVRADWYHLWAENQQGEKYLTMAGKQAASVHGIEA